MVAAAEGWDEFMDAADEGWSKAKETAADIKEGAESATSRLRARTRLARRDLKDLKATLADQASDLKEDAREKILQQLEKLEKALAKEPGEVDELDPTESAFEMGEFTRPFEDLGKEASEYIDLRLDDIKLRTAKGLSMTLSKLLYMLLVLFVVSIVLTAVAIGGVMWIGEMIGSYAGGAAIVAAFFLLVLGVLILLRKKLFRDTFVPLFIKLFFDDDK